MAQCITGAEKQYRSTATRLGFSLLIFYGLFQIYSVIMTALVPLLTDELSKTAGTVLYEILYGVLYAIAFVVPVLFYYLISKKEWHMPLDAQLILPRETPLYIFAGIALVRAAGYLNAMLLEVFDYSVFTQEVIFDTQASTNYELVLMFFTLAIVPGFVEELLFRGLILKNLLPYGRTTAVFASALLFGIMHQNPGQFLYATVAGLVFGYVYVHTKSLWCCVLMHVCNNFLSVLLTGIGERLPESNATFLVLAIDLVIFALGIAGAIYLILHAKRDPDAVLYEGAFERELTPDVEYAEIPVPLSRRIRLFFSVPMIIYFALCAAQMILLLVLSLLF